MPRTVISTTTKLTFEVPSTPNFIKTEQMDGMVSIGDVSDEDLKRIGEEWLSVLLDKAGRIRNAPK